MFCPNCKNEMVSQGNENICPHCGMRINTNQMQANSPQYYGQPQQARNDDKSSAGMGCLGFLFPVVGFILWLVWKKDYPLKARSAGIGALVSVIIGVIGGIIGAIVNATALGGAGGDNGQGAFNIIGALAFKFFGI